ncbi:MAG: hypothetical protein AB8F95_01175 [Bacteroidia bacterium]
MDTISTISLKLEVAGKTELMVYVTRSGTINRLGGGDSDTPEAMCMGRTEDPIVEDWSSSLDDSLLEMTGRYTMPDAEKGKACYLELALEGEGLDTGFAFNYGSEGMGPPEEIINLVDLLATLTDPWYEAQLAKKN